MSRQIGHNLEEKTRSRDVILDEKVDFKSMLLPQKILEGLNECNFFKPSPVQLKAIPPGRCGFDLIVKSKSGTGKTVVFSVVALEVIDVAVKKLQAIIVVPTREIAVQIEEVIKSIGSRIEGLKVEAFIGGLPLEKDKEKSKGCQIAVGAPGRLKHLITSGFLETSSVKLFVLDEADKLLQPTFQKDINAIFNVLPERKQTLALSATYPKDLLNFLNLYMASPTFISSDAENETPTLLGLKQFALILNGGSVNVVQQIKAKNEALQNLLTSVSFAQCLVFSNYQTRAESVSNFLNQKGWKSAFISAAQTQAKRLEAINALRTESVRVLLSTDLTARGIDASNVNLVVNFDIPSDPLTYLHRMGRAGRYGASGLCVNLVFDGPELKQLQNIQGAIGGFSIPVVPPFGQSEKFLDLWNVPDDLVQIPATVSQDFAQEYCEKIKADLYEWKKNSSRKKNEKRDKVAGESGINLAENFGEMLDCLKKSEEVIEEQYGSQDCLAILQSLTGADKSETLSECESNEKETKKRKRNVRETASSVDLNKCLHREKSKPRKPEDEDETFRKNVALLNVSKLLTGAPQKDVDKNVTNSIGDYLKLLKESDFNGEQTKEDDKEADNLDNIFQLGYDYAVSENCNHWLNHFSTEQIAQFKKLSLNNEAGTSEEESEDCFESCGPEESKYDSVVPEGGADEARNFLKWVPLEESEENLTVEKQKTQEFSYDLSLNCYNNDYFDACYQHCSDELWNSALEFETVEGFDVWFYQWQQKVMAVRNYVQQNIYVEEMNKFKKSRHCS